MQRLLTKESAIRIGRSGVNLLGLGALILAIPAIALAASKSKKSDIGEPELYSSKSVEELTKPSATSETALGLKAGMRARSITDQLTDARQAGAFIAFDLRKTLLPEVDARIDAGVNLYAGNSRTLYSKELESGSYMWVEQALLDWHPLGPEVVSLRGGVILEKDQEFRSPLLQGGYGFPGVAEAYHVTKSKQFELTLLADQAIPTSSNLSTRAVQAESTPWFLYERALVKAKPSSKLSLAASLGHFAYGPLPSNVAQESKLMGNTVNGVGADSADFAYNFEGYETSVKTEYDFTRSLGFAVQGSQLKNLRAPEGSNQGLFSNAELIFHFKRTEIHPEIGFFRNESDSAPAYYNEYWLGHNNRNGYFLGLHLDTPALDHGNIELIVHYGRENVLNPTALQADRNFFSAEVSTKYAIL